LSNHLTAGQRAWIAAELEHVERNLSERAREHTSGLSRVEHAHEVLEQDADDAPQRDGERELDLALTDRDQRELERVRQALGRVETEQFGVCIDCGEAIAFDRLKVEPWAVRCIACAEALENRKP
jgi:DnaK suppressor protein